VSLRSASYPFRHRDCFGLFIAVAVRVFTLIEVLYLVSLFEFSDLPS